MTPLAAFIDWSVPPARRGDADFSWRARFFTQACLLAVGLALLSIGFYVVGGWWPGVISLALLALVLPLMPIVMRVTGALRPTVHLALVITLISFIVPTFIERSIDGALLALFGLFPYLAMLILDARAGWQWLGLIALSLVSIVVSHELQLFPLVKMDSPQFVSLSRVAMLVAAVFFFGLRFSLERQQAMAELARASRVKSVFLANMSHELRTPMNAVLGLTELMLAEGLSASQRDRLELVQRSGRHLVELLDGLLDLAKIEANKLRLVPEDFDLCVLVHDLQALFEPVATRRGLRFSLACAMATPCVVRGDPLRLRQVLSNLASNAVKFTEQGAVTLEVEVLADRRYRFAVRDTGIGISPEAAGRLFAPFEQADASTTRRFGGTGLGLAVSRQLVHLMGGALKLESTPGQGSRFWFEVPLPQGEKAPPRPTAEVTAAVSAALLEFPVLVVDDNPINLTVARALVERAGYTVVTATNGQEAITALTGRTFSVVLMDCHMPVMDGFEATRRIRALEGPAARVPIFALTASAMPEDLAACRASGMDDCLTKPVSLDELRRALARVGSSG